MKKLNKNQEKLIDDFKKEEEAAQEIGKQELFKELAKYCFESSDDDLKATQMWICDRFAKYEIRFMHHFKMIHGLVEGASFELPSSDPKLH